MHLHARQHKASCLFLCLYAFSTLILTSCMDTHTPVQRNLSTNKRVGQLLDSDTSGGFASVHRPRKFAFPRDHGAHPAYKKERWQYSGNVVTGNGNQIGYQVTIHRIGLASNSAQVINKSRIARQTGGKEAKQSQWRSNNLYLATVSITDSDNDEFYQTEKISRQALGMANLDIVKTANTAISEILSDVQTQHASYSFNIDNWTITSISEEIFPLHIAVAQDDIALDLTLYPSKDIKLHGDAGLSKMGPNMGNASYYYSINRLKTTGKITINGLAHHIKGDSWYEHEWGTDITGPDIQGVDRYSLQLSDGRDFAFYRIRDAENKIHPLSRGIMVFPNGNHENVKQGEIEFDVSTEWTSPESQVRYPVSWDIHIPKYRLTLHTTPLVKEQEIRQSRTYWEGAVRVAGYQNVSSTTLKTVNGYGYVSLMGYKTETKK